MLSFGWFPLIHKLLSPIIIIIIIIIIIADLSSVVAKHNLETNPNSEFKHSKMLVNTHNKKFKDC